jgi:hypothetical protein
MTSATHTNFLRCSLRSEGNAYDAKIQKKKGAKMKKIISIRYSIQTTRASALDESKRTLWKSARTQISRKSHYPSGDKKSRGIAGCQFIAQPGAEWSADTHAQLEPDTVSPTPRLHVWKDKIDHALCRRYFCWERGSGENHLSVWSQNSVY